MAKALEKLIATDTPGVYRNERGVLVDAKGVAVSFKKLKQQDAEALEEAHGSTVRLPHEMLWAKAQDPRLPLAMRLDLAHKAAPYYAAKKELGSGDFNQSPEEAAQRILSAVRAMDATVGAAPAKGKAAK